MVMLNDAPSPKSAQIAQRWTKLAGLIETVAEAMYNRTNLWIQDSQRLPMTWTELDIASQDMWRQLACEAIDAIATYRS